MELVRHAGVVRIERGDARRVRNATVVSAQEVSRDSGDHGELCPRRGPGRRRTDYGTAGIGRELRASARESSHHVSRRSACEVVRALKGHGAHNPAVRVGLEERPLGPPELLAAGEGHVRERERSLAIE